MQENKLFEALLDVIPFAAYAVDINTFEVVYANKMMSEKMYAPREEFCWKKIFGQEEVCSWCTISTLKQREAVYKSEKLIGSFFDEVTDSWLQTYDEIVRWPDGRTVKYSIAVDITEQKEIQANMIKTHTKLAIQSKKLQEVNKQLTFMANKDFLTGINNRGHFFKLAKELFSKEKSIYLSMFDLDKFKNINDTYGHSTGDLVIKEFANIVLENIDKNDLFGRLGGEEFALVCIDDCEKTMINKLEKIRVSTQNSVIFYKKKEVKFTVSIGVHFKEIDETLDSALDKADRKLYDAKNTGRNKIKFRV